MTAQSGAAVTTMDESGDDAPQDGLDSDVSVTTDAENPVASFVASSSYSREDINLVLSAASLLLWVGTTIYLTKVN